MKLFRTELKDTATQHLLQQGSRRRALALIGAAGIGKSTLVDAIHASVLESGCDVMVIDDIDQLTAAELIATIERLNDQQPERLVIAGRAIPTAMRDVLDRQYERRIVGIAPLDHSDIRVMLADLGVAPWGVVASRIVECTKGNPRDAADVALSAPAAEVCAEGSAATSELGNELLTQWLNAHVALDTAQRDAVAELAVATVTKSAKAAAVDTAHALAVLVEHEIERGDYEASVQYAETASSMLATLATNPELESSSLLRMRIWVDASASTVRALRGEPTALLSLHALAGAANRARAHAVEARIWNQISIVSGSSGDTEIAWRAATRGIEVADMCGDWISGLLLRLSLVHLLTADAEYDEASQYLSEIIDAADSLGYHMIRLDALSIQARVLHAQEDYAGARMASDTAMQVIMSGVAARSVQVDIRVISARVRAHSGDVAGALRALGTPKSCAEGAADSGVEYWLALEAVRIHALHDQPRDDMTLWSNVLADWGTDIWGGSLTAARAEVEAWHEWVQGRRNSAARLAGRAHTLWEQASCKEELAATQVMSAQQRPVAIRPQIIHDATTAESVDDPVAFEVLTKREREIARYVAGGHTNPEIAGELHLSPRTVEHHVANILRKLELSSRRDLVHGRV